MERHRFTDPKGIIVIIGSQINWQNTQADCDGDSILNAHDTVSGCDAQLSPWYVDVAHWAGGWLESMAFLGIICFTLIASGLFLKLGANMADTAWARFTRSHTPRHRKPTSN